MAGIGISLFLAYVIEATWLAQHFDSRDSKKSEIFQGTITGIALCGLFAIGLTLMLSEHPEAKPAPSIDDYYFWWSSTAFAFLGVLVAIQPALAHELGQSQDDDSDD
ncbi:MAG TPA: hypothetical protein VFT79_09900 [Solirubrobacterales bacterium]|nr:hypothetical protein [Solirubrobacterales bacterium]